jgi:hypothetical protein
LEWSVVMAQLLSNRTTTARAQEIFALVLVCFNHVAYIIVNAESQRDVNDCETLRTRLRY